VTSKHKTNGNGTMRGFVREDSVKEMVARYERLIVEYREATAAMNAELERLRMRAAAALRSLRGDDDD